MKKSPPARQVIMKLLKERGSVKQDLIGISKDVFLNLKEVVQEIAKDLNEKAMKLEKPIAVEVEDKSEFQINLRIGEDVIIFVLHTNIYTFDKNNQLWKTSYFQDDPLRAYCGMIYVYNFLHDSFRYNRINDGGYLIARIFINKDSHYFVEGKRQLGVLYNDLAAAIADRHAMTKIVESAILYALDFDTFVPPYEEVKELSVQEMLDITINMRIRTGKRMGFQFRVDETRIE